jgi:hypothetical protein
MSLKTKAVVFISLNKKPVKVSTLRGDEFDSVINQIGGSSFAAGRSNQPALFS